LLLPLWLAGCGGQDAGLHPVVGRMTCGDVPVANASLGFHPAGAASRGAPCPVGRTQADGSYQLTTRSAGDGAPPGEYVVTILWPDDSKEIDECECVDLLNHDRLHGRYANAATSPLQVTIGAGPNRLNFRATVDPRSEIRAGRWYTIGRPDGAR